jgi:hypothetical protein
MDNRENAPQIPYSIHEGMMARQERTIRRLWILCIIIFIALIATNAGWIYYESQFITEEVTQDVDTGNGAAYVAGIGDIYGTDQTNGQTESS